MFNYLYYCIIQFSYDVGGETIEMQLLPGRITVQPDPRLLVHYFWEKHVRGDDPFTEEREPSEPFSLGVVIKNGGFGTAHNVMFSSEQPGRGW